MSYDTKKCVRSLKDTGLPFHIYPNYFRYNDKIEFPTSSHSSSQSEKFYDEKDALLIASSTYVKALKDILHSNKDGNKIVIENKTDMNNFMQQQVHSNKKKGIIAKYLDFLNTFWSSRLNQMIVLITMVSSIYCFCVIKNIYNVSKLDDGLIINKRRLFEKIFDKRRKNATDRKVLPFIFPLFGP